MTAIVNPVFNWTSFQGLNEEEIEGVVDRILFEMTLDEKIAQMQGDDPFFKGLRQLVKHYNEFPIPAGACPRLGIPPILFTDGPRGVVVGHSTCFPVSMARGASWDVDLEERIGNCIGIEARAQGANFFGGVCINLLRHPSWGRAQETYGEDPVLLGEMGAALVKGVQNHVMACVKHYAANSIENARNKVNVILEERTLREIYLPHFHRCIEAGAASVMGAYNKLNGDHCCENRHLLTNILKKDWKFQGFTISDFVLGIRNGKKAIQAGLDIEMPLSWKMHPKKMKRWIQSGQISIDLINLAVRRILRQKLRFNLPFDPDRYSLRQVASLAHTQLALESARKSIVLLQNRDQTLPLKLDQIQTIAVVGRLANSPNIGDRGSSRVYPPYVITPYQGIQRYVGDKARVILIETDSLNQAQEIAKTSNVAIVVVGYSYKEEGEYIIWTGGDRTCMDLPRKDEALIHAISEVNPRTIVIIETGSAILVEKWKDRVASILMAWYPGMEGGTALAEILFGSCNPSGKLPISFPFDTDQLPFFNKNAREITYGYYHGYRLMEKQGYTPSFPFGFGLSYTSFEYSDLKVQKEILSAIDTIAASVHVKNTGIIAGEEIIQLYIGYKNMAVDHPMKDLKAFQRVTLNPSQEIVVILSLPVSKLSYFAEEQRSWIIEKTSYVVYVGPSSEKKRLLSTTIQII